MGYRGGNYVWTVARVLLAPGAPVRIEVKTPGGVVIARASAYAIDPVKGTAWIADASLTDPQGVAIANVKRARATGLDALRGADQVVRVRLTDVYARIERDPKGFDFQRYLPKPSGKPGTIPYEVEVVRARATFIDRTKTVPWKRELATDRVRLAGLGDDITAHGVVRAEGVGKVPIRFHQTSNGLGIDGQLPPLDPTELVRRFMDAPLLKEARWTRLVVGGPIRVWLPKKSEANLEASFAAEINGFAYRDVKIEAARFDGTVNAKGIVGKVEALEGGAQATFQGSALLSPFAVGGKVAVRVASREAIPAPFRSQIPPEIGFRDAGFTGWIAGSKAEDVEVSGEVEAASARYGTDSVQNLAATLRGDCSRLLVSLPRTLVRGIPVSGLGAFDLTNMRAVAALRTETFDLAKLPAKGLTGTGQVDASLSGPLKDPAVRFTAVAKGGYANYKIPELEAAGIWTRQGFVVTRGFARGLGGIAGIDGKVSPTGVLNLRATVRSVRLGAIDPRLNGSTSAEAKIVGTIRDPKAYGRIETYLATWQGQTIPAASARFSADRQGARIADLYALRGTGVATGAASLRFADGKLNGKLSALGIQAGDFLGEQVVGTVDVPELTLGGSLAKPLLAGRIEGDSVVVRGIKVDGFVARIDTDDAGALRLQGASANVLNGTVTARGVYDPRGKTGAFDIEAKGLSLPPLAEELARGSTLDGTVGVRIEGTIAGGRLAVATADSSLRDVRLNGELLGSGALDARLEGQTVTGNVELGQIDRYLRVSDIAVNLESKTVKGQVEASNLSVKSLVAIGLPYAPDISYNTERSLRALDGGIFLAAGVTGDWERPNVTLETLEARTVTYDGKALGGLMASGDYENGNAKLASLTIDGPIGNARAHGALSEAGALDAEIDPVRIDLGKLGAVVPALAGRTGTIDASAALGGTQDEPTLRGTLNARRIMADPTQPEDRGLRVDLDSITASAKEGVGLEGDFFYRGFQGKIVASAAAPPIFGDSAPRPTEATLTLAQRPLAEIAGLFDGLDAKRTSGTLGGVAVLKQMPGEQARLSGRIEAKGELAFDLVPETIKALDASLALDGSRLALMVNGDPSQGGKVAATASVDLGDPLALASEVSKSGATAILARSIEAKMGLTDVNVKQTFPRDASALLSGGSLNGIVNGSVDVAGPLSGPKVAGRIDLTGVDTQIPTVQTKPGVGGQALVDPSFDLNIRLTNPAHVRSATADLQLLGGGRIAGRLSGLDVNSHLNVENGTIRLPGALVRLEQGGTIDVGYNGRSDQPAEAQVNLEGRAGVTAQSPTGTTQRYDISLTVKGDLLKDGGLVLNATSDPGDLSQDRILALLGATDTLNVLNTGTSRNAAESQVRDALIGFTLPSLLDPITGRLASSLGFDYLTLEYNPFERASVVFGRTLGGDFSVQGRRQVEAIPGQVVRYDLRLVYRPRRARGIFSRLGFSVGADETRPLKFAIEYSVRF